MRLLCGLLIVCLFVTASPAPVRTPHIQSGSPIAIPPPSHIPHPPRRAAHGRPRAAPAPASRRRRCCWRARRARRAAAAAAGGHPQRHRGLHRQHPPHPHQVAERRDRLRDPGQGGVPRARRVHQGPRGAEHHQDGRRAGPPPPLRRRRRLRGHRRLHRRLPRNALPRPRLPRPHLHARRPVPRKVLPAAQARRCAHHDPPRAHRLAHALRQPRARAVRGARHAPHIRARLARLLRRPVRDAAQLRRALRHHGPRDLRAVRRAAQRVRGRRRHGRHALRRRRVPQVAGRAHPHRARGPAGVWPVQQDQARRAVLAHGEGGHAPPVAGRHHRRGHWHQPAHAQLPPRPPARRRRHPRVGRGGAGHGALPGREGRPVPGVLQRGQLLRGAEARVAAGPGAPHHHHPVRQWHQAPEQVLEGHGGRRELGHGHCGCARRG